MKISIVPRAVALTLSVNAVHAADLYLKPGEDLALGLGRYESVINLSTFSGVKILCLASLDWRRKNNFERVTMAYL